MLTLYYAKGTAAIVPHILLEEIGVAYETRRLDFAQKEHQAEPFLAVNPKARVPALATPEGILTETPAIIAYLAQSFPEAGLAPRAPFDFARAQEFTAYLAATVHVAHAHRMRSARWADDPAAQESMKAKVAENMTDCARMIEAQYLKGPWVMGDAYSICDPYLLLVRRWMPADGVDISAFPRIEAHFEAMMARPAVQRALALHD